MKDRTAGVAIETFVGLKPKMYLVLVEDGSENKKKRVWIKLLLQQKFIINTKIFYWIINVWNIRWIESKVKITE